MKKISTLLVTGLLLCVFSASAQQTARVTVNAPDNYDVAIDGKFVNTTVYSPVTEVAQGNHTLQVYQVVSNGILGIGKKRNLISTQQFSAGYGDIAINVDQNGRARITGNGSYGNNYPNQGNTGTRYPDNRYPDRRERRDDDREWDKKGKTEKGRYGRSQGKGNGNKYGHYKNKKSKSNSQGNQNNQRW